MGAGLDLDVWTFPLKPYIFMSARVSKQYRISIVVNIKHTSFNFIRIIALFRAPDKPQ